MNKYTFLIKDSNNYYPIQKLYIREYSYYSAKKQALRIIKAWDRNRTNEDEGGHYELAEAKILQRYKRQQNSHATIRNIVIFAILLGALLIIYTHYIHNI
jgi:hypothetical protein